MIFKLKGDCTEPIDSTRNMIIPNINNNLGLWGSGVVMAISAKWSGPEKQYRKWYKDNYYLLKGVKIPFQLGQTQLVKVNHNTYVANMLAQSGVGYRYGMPPVRYECLEECLFMLKELISGIEDHSLHMPELGCGRGGGSLDIVESILNKVFPDQDMYMYKYEGEFA
jgi:O-acetyl-ADP-ribose deacetylase (regulator of RNase III)